MNKIKTIGFTLLASAMVMGIAGCKDKAKTEKAEAPAKEEAAKAAHAEHPEHPEHPTKGDPSKAKPLDHPAH